MPLGLSPFPPIKKKHVDATRENGCGNDLGLAVDNVDGLAATGWVACIEQNRTELHRTELN